MMVSQEAVAAKKKRQELTRRLITGQILRKDLVGGKKLADTVTELAGSEKEEFLDFASGMLQWMPEKRKTAGGTPAASHFRFIE